MNYQRPLDRLPHLLCGIRSLSRFPILQEILFHAERKQDIDLEESQQLIREAKTLLRSISGNGPNEERCVRIRYVEWGFGLGKRCIRF